ncbi:unnamed protein product, partial [Meganyctiphanes norvegica]
SRTDQCGAMAHIVNLFLLLPLLLVILLAQGKGVRGHKKSKVFQTKSENKNIDEERKKYEVVKEKLRDILSKANPVDDDNFDRNKFNNFNNDIHTLDYIPTSRKRGLDFDQISSLQSSGIQQEYTSANNRVSSADTDHGHAGHEHTTQYLNEWAVHVEGGPNIAQSLATDLGYTYKGKIGRLEDVYLLLKADHPAIHRRAAPHLTRHLHAQEPVG